MCNMTSGHFLWPLVTEPQNQLTETSSFSKTVYKTNPQCKVKERYSLFYPQKRCGCESQEKQLYLIEMQQYICSPSTLL